MTVRHKKDITTDSYLLSLCGRDICVIYGINLKSDSIFSFFRLLLHFISNKPYDIWFSTLLTICLEFHMISNCIRIPWKFHRNSRYFSYETGDIHCIVKMTKNCHFFRECLEYLGMKRP